jgi:hypothetical protein
LVNNKIQRIFFFMIFGLWMSEENEEEEEKKMKWRD